MGVAVRSKLTYSYALVTLSTSTEFGCDIGDILLRVLARITWSCLPSLSEGREAGSSPVHKACSSRDAGQMACRVLPMRFVCFRDSIVSSALSSERRHRARLATTCGLLSQTSPCRASMRARAACSAYVVPNTTDSQLRRLLRTVYRVNAR